MKRNVFTLQGVVLVLGLLAPGVSMMAVPAARNQDTQQTAPDNTKKNKDQTALPLTNRR
jgi:hypothetical protein